MKVFENYLLKDFKNHAADLGPALVDTCFVYFLSQQQCFRPLGCYAAPKAKTRNGSFIFSPLIFTIFFMINFHL